MLYSLSEQLMRAARQSRAARVHDHVGSMDWQGIAQRVALMAGVLRDLGVAPGDRVALLGHNSIDYLCLYFAIPWAGAISVPVNTRLSTAEVIEQLEDSQSSVLLADTEYSAVAQAARERLPLLRHIVCMGRAAAPSGMQSMEQLLAGVAPAADAGRRDDDVAILFYTGGTTGRSKGVMLTHQGVVVGTLQWAYTVGVGAEDTLLIAIPMFHIAAGMNAIAAVMLAAGLVIQPRFDPPAVLELIARHRVSKTALVPTALEMLITSPGFARADVSSLTRITYGGAPMPTRILELALQKLPHTRFYQIYGQTESGGVATCLLPGYHVLGGEAGHKRHTAGQPVVGMDLRILDADGEELPRGEVGEICLRGLALTPGYWNRAEQTAALYTDGWLRTGDAGFLDADGFLTIVDRVKDMIISGGENVYAAEVEGVLYQHPAVAQCAVIGIPSERWGEEIHAVVLLHAGGSAGAEEQMAFCRERIGAFKCPRSVSFRQEPLPATSLGKIRKNELRAPFWAGRGHRGRG